MSGPGSGKSCELCHPVAVTACYPAALLTQRPNERRANAMPATNSKGKVAAKATSRDTRIDSNDNTDDENNASSAGLPGADDHQYGEDNDGYGYDLQSQRIRFPLRQAWKSYLLTSLLALITILLGLGLLVLIIADSYAAPAINRLNLLLEGPTSVKMKFLENALILGGPESVSVDSFGRRDSEGDPERNGLEVNVTVAVRLGVDTDYIMGFPDIGTRYGWLDRVWMKTVRWGVSQLGAVTAHVDQLEISSLNSEDHRGNSLITIRPTSLVPIPLCPNLRAHNPTRLPIADHCNPPLLHLPVSIYPSDNATDIIGFLESNWKDGWLKVVATVSGVTVVGGAPSELNHSDPDGSHPAWDERPKWWQFSKWRRWIQVYRPSVKTRVELQVSPLQFPDMPPISPGSELPDISDLLVLESFVASTSAPPQPLTRPPSSDFVPSDSDIPNFNNLQHVLSTHNNEYLESIGYSQILHDSEQLTLNRENIVILAQASLKHPLGDLAELLDLGIRASAIPLIVSLPIPPPGNGGGGGDNGDSSFATGKPALTSSQSSTSIPVVKVFTSPTFNETHIRLPIWGYVLPFPDPDSQGNSSSNYDFTPNRIPASSTITVQDFTRAVSTFIRSYLSYEPSPILLTTPFYPTLEIAAAFPPPEQKIQIIRDVRLENMWIKPGGIFGINTNSNENIKEIVNGVMGMFAGYGGREMFHVKNHAVHSEVAGAERENMENTDVWSSFALEVLASATVHGRVVLPRGFNIDLEVTRLWVDALIFDGDVPAEDEGGDDEDEVEVSKAVSDIASDPPLPTPFPLPTPLPPRAFARITPKTWLNATSSLTKPGERAEAGDEDEDGKAEEGEGDEDDGGKSIYVTAEAVDVPLQVLPGRQADLRRFVTKVLFSSDPVIAGIRGVVAVAVKIPGLTVQTGLEPATAGDHHTQRHKRDPTSPFFSALDLSSDSNLDSRDPESDPRIEGSELILTDLPFEGKVPIGGSRAWISQ